MSAFVQTSETSRPAAGGLDVDSVRREFPILARTVAGKPLAYLDNAATTQKPQRVIDAVSSYYANDNANVHRGVHTLSVRATEAYESARTAIQRFIGARSPKEIIFVRGATEGINLVAQAFARPRLAAGDEIVISEMEHHSNIVPWQILCEQTGARLRVIPITDAGDIDLDAYADLLGPRTRIVGLVHVSNALGTVNPIDEMTRLARRHGAAVVIDGAQAVPHMPVDVRQLDCDFYALSGHKMYAPTGIGVLYGRQDLLNEMPPYQGGGDMISSVTFEKTTYNDLPYKFEAGTPNIAGAIGLGVAAEYLASLGLDAIAAHEHELLDYATRRVSSIPRVRLVGTARRKAAVLSFVIDGAHPHDAGTIMDREGVAIRAGHHCAQPVMQRYGVPATVRASFGVYSTREEVDALVAAVHKVLEVFS
jgi:cysteine desulfurase/selenocysteine lyase